MQYPILDQVALSFAREFYRALAQYYPVDAAVTEGRRAVYQDLGSDQPDWGTPVIFMRSPDGMLFSPPQAAQAGERAADSGSGVSIRAEQVTIMGDVAGRDIIKSGSQPAPGTSGAPIADLSPQQLRDVLSSRFDFEELRTFCFDMNVDFDSLPGEGKAAKARELVAYMQRRGRLPELVAAIRRTRPDIQ
jgi:hypothetical protein